MVVRSNFVRRGGYISLCFYFLSCFCFLPFLSSSGVGFPRKVLVTWGRCDGGKSLEAFQTMLSVFFSLPHFCGSTLVTLLSRSGIASGPTAQAQAWIDYIVLVSRPFMFRSEVEASQARFQRMFAMSCAQATRTSGIFSIIYSRQALNAPI